MSDVSVLVPSYGHAKFVERALRSIFAQTVRITKLVVIDDGSPDDSPEVIRSVLRDCPFEYEFIARENRGLCSTLNEGLALTSGKYFAYLGSDDVWLPEMLAEQIALLKRRPQAALAFSHAYVIDGDDNIVDRTDTWSEFDLGDPLRSLLMGVVFSSPGVVYRRVAVEKYGWNEDSPLEDYELYLNLTAEGEFAGNSKLLCGWRKHGRNASDDHYRMAGEQLAAQWRCRSRLGLSETELRDVQRSYKFATVRSLVRSGQRAEAWRWFRESAAGAVSTGEYLGTLLRLLVPASLFRWNTRRKRELAIRRYGKLRLSE